MQDNPGADAAEAAEAGGSKKAGAKGKKGKKGKGGDAAGAEADVGKQAELEMLLMDDAALLAAARGGGGGGLAPASGKQAAGDGGKKLSRKERIRQKKEAKRRERQEGSDDEDAAGGLGCLVAQGAPAQRQGRAALRPPPCMRAPHIRGLPPRGPCLHRVTTHLAALALPCGAIVQSAAAAALAASTWQTHALPSCSPRTSSRWTQQTPASSKGRCAAGLSRMLRRARHEGESAMASTPARVWQSSERGTCSHARVS